MFSKETFSNRIREQRMAKSLKQSELGKIVGLSDNAISDIERGYRLTTIDKIVELADFFDVSIDYLVGRTDNPKMNKLKKLFLIILQIIKDSSKLGASVHNKTH